MGAQRVPFVQEGESRTERATRVEPVVSDFAYNSMQVPVAVKNRVRSFYRFQYADGKVYDEAELLSTLSPKLKGEISTFIQRELFEKVNHTL